MGEARGTSRGLGKAVKVERRDVLAERKEEAAAKVTFREAARQYHAENKAAWKSAVYARQWLASLENHAFTKLGDIPTGGIGSPDIIAVLTPIWQEIPETDRKSHVCTPVTNAHLVCRLLLEKKKQTTN